MTFNIIAVHYLIGPDADGSRRHEPSAYLGFIIEPYRRWIFRGNFFEPKGIIAITTGWNTIRLASGLPSPSRLPFKVPLLGNILTWIRLRPDTKGVGGRFAADVPIPAIVVPGEASRNMDSHASSPNRVAAWSYHIRSLGSSWRMVSGILRATAMMVA